MPFDYEARQAELLAAKDRLKIGIVGFGNFGHTTPSSPPRAATTARWVARRRREPRPRSLRRALSSLRARLTRARRVGAGGRRAGGGGARGGVLRGLGRLLRAAPGRGGAVLLHREHAQGARLPQRPAPPPQHALRRRAQRQGARPAAPAAPNERGVDAHVRQRAYRECAPRAMARAGLPQAAHAAAAPAVLRHPLHAPHVRRTTARPWLSASPWRRSLARSRASVCLSVCGGGGGVVVVVLVPARAGSARRAARTAGTTCASSTTRWGPRDGARAPWRPFEGKALGLGRLVDEPRGAAGARGRLGDEARAVRALPAHLRAGGVRHGRDELRGARPLRRELAVHHPHRRPHARTHGARLHAHQHQGAPVAVVVVVEPAC
eukprot:scaffold63_cov366-Prasinococcus_capsulatus_cf.AAC.5